MFRRIIKLIRQEKVSLFIGSGFSIKAGAPSVPKLKKIMLDDFDDDKQRVEQQNDTLQDLSQYYVEKVCAGSRQNMIADLKNAFSFTPLDLADHKLLAQIPHFRHIFTTNYDTLLEDSYDKDDVQVVRKDQDLTGLDEKKYVTIYKIHGDFQDADSVIITKSDYAALMNKKKRSNDLLWKELETEFAKKYILFIGYSLEDDNILEIIRAVTKKLGKNHKQMFLLAPSIKSERQEELRKMHVTYLKSFATPFLEELTKEILEHSHEDFESKKLSNEAFSRVCNIHGFDTSKSTPIKGKNTINGISALPGKTLIQQLNFTVDKEIGEQIKASDFEKFGQNVKGLPFSDLPCIKISGTSLFKSNYVVNDVVLGSDFQSIFIFPTTEILNLTIRIPSRDFFEMVESRCYRLNDEKFVLSFDCCSYKTTITLFRKDRVGDGTAMSANFEFEFYSNYKDNTKALLWIDFVDAAFQNELIEIKEISSIPFNSPKNMFSKKTPVFADIKTYYEDIKAIEMYTGSKFTVYNAYSENSGLIANMLRSYYTHTPVNIACKDGVRYKARVDKTSEFALTAKKSKKFSMVAGNENIELEINGRIFCIPYVYSVFNNSEIIQVRQERDGIELLIIYPGENYQMFLSDRPATQEFTSLDTTMSNIELSKNIRRI